jgi:acyl-CoA synthetase (AMP-forming)/AMP-acid ligase II
LCGGVPDDRLGETVHLLIVKRLGAQIDADDLLIWASSRLEKQKLPNAIHYVDELPLGRTGKADRAGVKQFVLNAGN